MALLDLIQEASRVLSANKFRSGLTILGIVIGISSIILMMSIGKGAEFLILNEISGMGAETIAILPGQQPSGLSGGASVIFGDSLKARDIDALSRKENTPYIVDLAPVVIVPGSVTFEREVFSPTIIGSSALFFGDVFNVGTQSGFLFDDVDVRGQASVAVIGDKVAESLFGQSSALGEQITIKNRKFRVVGVFQKAGQVSFFNFDELVLIPYTTAKAYITGNDYFNRIIARAESAEYVDRTVRDIEITLREVHNIENPKDDDFSVVTQQGIADQVKTIIGALTILLSSVVAIALVVGGIGVMNIMLVSVTERTREIGLRKALGATEKDILNQFLIEAIILTLLGGIIGILLGLLLAFLASLVLTNVLDLNWKFVFPWQAALLGLVVSGAVGLVFGVWPAKTASKKDPIEALRYE